MTRKRLAALILAATLLTPGSLLAGPECKSGDCPRNEYPRLHYWAPTFYLLRAYLHPTSLDQFPPGPMSVCVPPSFDTVRFRCPSTPPIQK